MGDENNVVIGHNSDSTGISENPVIILGDNIRKGNISNSFIIENEAYTLIVGKTILNNHNNLHELFCKINSNEEKT